MQAVVARLSLLVGFIFCFALDSLTAWPAAAAVRADAAVNVRAENYELDIQSGRGSESPKIIALWAVGKYLNHPFKVNVPSRFFISRRLKVHYQWAAGTALAGQSERVELHWRRAGGVWQKVILGQGFRDPLSGQLLLFPADIQLEEGYTGQVEIKFMLQLTNGDWLQDGGIQSQFSLFAAPESSANKLSFAEDWKTFLTGRLRSGQTFELHYDKERLFRQMNLRNDEPAPWILVAHIQFDDKPPEEYPLLAVVSGLSTHVVPYVPTIVIPEQAKHMAIWFLAFYNSQSYFDSNFGMNFNFEIPTN